MIHSKFPLIRDIENLPYISEMDSRHRAFLEKERQDFIRFHRLDVLSELELTPEVVELSTEAKEYLAERIAIALRRSQEHGFQQAVDVYEPALRGSRAASLGVTDPKYIGVDLAVRS